MAGGGAEEGTAMPLPRPPPSRRVPKNDASFAQVEFPRPAPRDVTTAIISTSSHLSSCIVIPRHLGRFGAFWCAHTLEYELIL